MKKLLIFMLVLGMASMANGAVTLEIGGSAATDQTILVGQTLTMQVYSSDATAWRGYILADDTYISTYTADGALSNPNVLPPAGNLGNTNPYSLAGWGIGYTIVAGSTIGDLTSGIQFTFDYVGGSDGDMATIVLYDDNIGWNVGDQVGDFEITVIPEPTTIALLGLGGLFLLRRRK